jgi:hypothetical protein
MFKPSKTKKRMLDNTPMERSMYFIFKPEMYFLTLNVTKEYFLSIFSNIIYTVPNWILHHLPTGKTFEIYKWIKCITVLLTKVKEIG